MKRGINIIEIIKGLKKTRKQSTRLQYSLIKYIGSNLTWHELRSRYKKKKRKSIFSIFINN